MTQSILREPVVAEWWCGASQLVRRVNGGRSGRRLRAAYRFGDGLLEIDADDGRLLDDFRRLYRECAVPSADGTGAVRVRCSVDTIDEPPVTVVTFSEPALRDHTAMVLGLLQHPISNPHWYSEVGSPVPGWRLVGKVGNEGAPLTAIRGADVIIDRLQEPPDFLLNYLVGIVLRLQKDVLFVHAASVGIREAGVLLGGRTRSGKTTLSVTLASRGHAFLGDDVAAIRLGSRELLPFQQAVAIRPGLRARVLDVLVENGSYDAQLSADGTRRIRAYVGDVFPHAPAAPLPLRSAFFLHRLADRARVQSFTPSPRDLDLLKPLCYERTVEAAWGLEPGPRLMKFLILADLLSKIPCYLLEVGPPEETEDLIERTILAWA